MTVVGQCVRDCLSDGIGCGGGGEFLTSIFYIKYLLLE